MLVVFSASSALDIYRGEADLSRRVITYLIAGLSFREFILFTRGIDFEAINIDGIRKNHQSLSRMITENFRPLPAFRKYLEVSSPVEGDFITDGLTIEVGGSARIVNR